MDDARGSNEPGKRRILFPMLVFNFLVIEVSNKKKSLEACVARSTLFAKLS